MRETHGESGARAYNWGLEAEPPAGFRTLSGAKLLKLKGLQHWNVQKKEHFWPFPGILGT